MAKFPEISSIAWRNPFEFETEFRTAVNEFEGEVDAEEQRRQLLLYPRRKLTLAYEWLSISDAKTLWDFFMARKGRFGSFTFFWPFSSSYVQEFVGVGDGAATIFNLPSKMASSYTLYKNGASQSSGWTFTAAGGADGEDKAEFTTAPPVGDIITFSFTGYLKIRARFDEDVMAFEEFYNRLVNTGVRLKGLKNSE